ncbi:hypothetical protein GOODEAATRI_030537 [Goodea atripinnis]|uniref:Uncharacterized protein n=1 Tax=Goodea atripinnis TaxID=208336 RepID=A0ABV0PT26_9TELE
MFTVVELIEPPDLCGSTTVGVIPISAGRGCSMTSCGSAAVLCDVTPVKPLVPVFLSMSSIKSLMVNITDNPLSSKDVTSSLSRCLSICLLINRHDNFTSSLSCRPNASLRVSTSSCDKVRSFFLMSASRDSHSLLMMLWLCSSHHLKDVHFFFWLCVRRTALLLSLAA